MGVRLGRGGREIRRRFWKRQRVGERRTFGQYHHRALHAVEHMRSAEVAIRARFVECARERITQQHLPGREIAFVALHVMPPAASGFVHPYDRVLLVDDHDRRVEVLVALADQDEVAVFRRDFLNRSLDGCQRNPLRGAIAALWRGFAGLSPR